MDTFHLIKELESTADTLEKMAAEYQDNTVKTASASSFLEAISKQLGIE